MTLEELYQIGAAWREHLGTFKAEIQICGSGGCRAAGADTLHAAFEAACVKRKVASDVRIIRTGCLGLCGEGPLVRVLPDETIYHHVTAEIADRIVASHVLRGKPVRALRLDDNLPFFARQKPVVLLHMGRIDPESIEDYIAHGGYEALAKAVTYSAPEHVILEIRSSGLRGRGGGGYPTGLKWDIVRRGASKSKFVVCNADEGDPGAFMDRS
ncbi:MAG: NAD(P)H-dependent oxidoreductase subunit E, partial [Bacteroidetes bacterium]|nr:NAD(P)H-dependent oxidoreductase subunit E [Bacteroidota bacterium]